MNLEAQAKKAAISFRRKHRRGLQPLGDLVALIEQTTGHDVAIIDADPDEHGLTMHDPDREVTFIGIARTPHPMRQRSTLAHELAHVLFEDWNSQTEFGSRSPQEIRADAFARHLLLPEDGLRELLGNRKSLSTADLSAVVQRFSGLSGDCRHCSLRMSIHRCFNQKAVDGDKHTPTSYAVRMERSVRVPPGRFQPLTRTATPTCARNFRLQGRRRNSSSHRHT